jgi:hypothetical protein
LGVIPATGLDTLSVTFTPTDTADYNPTTTTVQLSVGRTTPTVTFTVSANPVMAEDSITLTAVASATAGTPTGQITFLDGTTVLGTASLSGGTASFSTTSLTVGSHTLTASYGGDPLFTPQVSAAITEVVQDPGFNIAPSGITATQEVFYGGTARFTFMVNPNNVPTFASPITFSVTGLPTGATASFSPSTLNVGQQGQDVIMTVTMPAQHAKLQETGPSHGMAPLALALLLLPFAAVRSRARRFKGLLCMMLLLAGGVSASWLTGCGSGSVHGTAYTLTVTATSTTGSHSTTVTLIVE